MTHNFRRVLTLLLPPLLVGFVLFVASSLPARTVAQQPTPLQCATEIQIAPTFAVDEVVSTNALYPTATPCVNAPTNPAPIPSLYPQSVGGQSIGLYNPINASSFLLSFSNANPSVAIGFPYGDPGNGLIPLTGDWDGDGDDTAGVYYRPFSSFILVDSNSSATPNYSFPYGPSNDPNIVPIVGDWNGDGKDTVGLFNRSNNAFLLINANESRPVDLGFVFNPISASGLVPVVGDWNNNGTVGVGIYNPATGEFALRNSLDNGTADYSFTFRPGSVSSYPLVGRWVEYGGAITGVGSYDPTNGALYIRYTLPVGTNNAANLASTFGQGNSGLIPLVGAWGTNSQATSTPSATRTRTFTPSSTATFTRTPTRTNTPTSTATATNTPTRTNTPSSTPTRTLTPSSTATYTYTPTATGDICPAGGESSAGYSAFAPCGNPFVCEVITNRPIVAYAELINAIIAAQLTPASNPSVTPTSSATPAGRYYPQPLQFHQAHV